MTTATITIQHPKKLAERIGSLEDVVVPVHMAGNPTGLVQRAAATFQSAMELHIRAMEDFSARMQPQDANP